MMLDVGGNRFNPFIHIEQIRIIKFINNYLFSGLAQQSCVTMRVYTAAILSNTVF